MKRPTDGALTGKSRREVGANILPFSEDARQRQHPNALRLDVLATFTQELRRIQRSDPTAGALTPTITLALEFADVIDSWERRP